MKSFEKASAPAAEESRDAHAVLRIAEVLLVLQPELGLKSHAHFCLIVWSIERDFHPVRLRIAIGGFLMSLMAMPRIPIEVVL